MKKEYDFSDAVKNPYTKEIKKQVTIKIAPYIIDYFKEESDVTGIPYQTLINLYLADCVKERKRLNMEWKRA